jgi:ubiquinone/menaquinone biosynthesis C-methylase UbiE
MSNAQVHFDNIASKYDEQLPAHIRSFLLDKKTALTVSALEKCGITSGRGIDLGCGTGWYVKNISERGYGMTGLDNSEQLIEEAVRNNWGNAAKIIKGDILKLDFPDNYFDFAYCINSLHHLKAQDDLPKALSSIHRVLRKGGVLIIHELNTFLLFRLFLDYVFPLTNKIDRFGGENWVSPGRLSKQDLFSLRELHYYTFFPHIIPQFMFGYFLKINDLCERIFFKKFGVHYMAVLVK